METLIIKRKDIDNLTLGASFLGTGGGGDPYIGGLMLKSELKENEYIEIIRDNHLNRNSFILGNAMMGAPIVMIEKIPSAHYAKKALEMYSNVTGKKIDYITPLEIGGVNSTIPLITSIKSGIPVIDGDGMGRAFPELQMTTFYFNGINPSPIVVFDEKGNSSVVEGIDGYWAEKISRSITLKYGGSAYISLYGTDLSTYTKSYVPGTLSLILELGELLSEKKLDNILHKLNGFIISSGKITEIYRVVSKGFSKGYLLIDGFNGDKIKIDFQNEYLICTKNNIITTSVPDLIVILDMFNLKPITTDRAKYGQKVIILGIPSSDKLRNSNALNYVGPKAFGYDIEYIPVEKRVKENGN